VAGFIDDFDASKDGVRQYSGGDGFLQRRDHVEQRAARLAASMVAIDNTARLRRHAGRNQG
jgi:hypothetical protein